MNFDPFIPSVPYLGCSSLAHPHTIEAMTTALAQCATLLKCIASVLQVSVGIDLTVLSANVINDSGSGEAPVWIIT